MQHAKVGTDSEVMMSFKRDLHMKGPELEVSQGSDDPLGGLACAKLLWSGPQSGRAL